MHRSPDIRRGQVNRKIRLGGDLVRVIDAGEALDLAVAGGLVDATLVRLLGVLERCRHVHEVEVAVLGDGVAGSLSAGLEGRNGRDDGGSAGLGELGGDKGNAGDVLVAVGAREAKFARELGAHGIAEEEGDGAASLLVEGDVEGTGDGVLARVLVASQEDGETLLAAGRVGFTENADDLRV